MSMYNKLFTKILDSSIWLEDTPTRIVWLTMIAAMDEKGYCQFASVANVAHRARVTPDEAAEAIRCLESPDANSSDPENEGRRLERVPGGWMVLNSEKHRAMVSKAVIQEQTRARVQRFRDRKRNSNAPVTPSEADTEADTDTEARTPTTESPSRVVGGLLTSPAAYDKLRKSFAFVGARLRVPHVLHDECRTKLGGETPDVALRAWYSVLDEAVELTGEPIPDVFVWLRPKFVAWAEVARLDAERERFRPAAGGTS